MQKYLIVIESEESNFSGYCPDLPGCVATGDSIENLEQNMLKAIQMHVEGLKKDNLEIPQSRSRAEYIAVNF